VIGTAILEAKKLTRNGEYEEAVALFHKKVTHLKAKNARDSFGAIGHRFPFALFALIQKHDFFSSLNANESFVAFSGFQDELRQMECAKQTPPELLFAHEWPDRDWLERVSRGLMYHPTRFANS
jgi:hypothetical protein